MGIKSAQAVILRGRLYLGGGLTSGGRRNEARLYIYTPTTDIWTTLDTPVRQFALVTYHYQVVLVGGRKYVGEHLGPVTNQLLTLDEQSRLQLQQILPPMKVRRDLISAVGYGDYLLVAAGQGDTVGQYLDTVEVYNGQTWSTAKPLPRSCCCMKSSILGGCWYLMGGGGQFATGFFKAYHDIFFAPFDSLIASRESSDNTSVWKSLTDTPHIRSTPVTFGSRLIAIGGEREGDLPVSFIHAYSWHTKSWVEVGNLPNAGCDCCVVVLSTGELIVIGGFVTDTSQAFKATMEGWCALHNCL